LTITVTMLVMITPTRLIPPVITAAMIVCIFRSFTSCDHDS
jgi:hypothetical protein